MKLSRIDMKNQNILFGILVLLFVTLMSVPYLVPHTGFLALIGFVPLLCLERIATMTGAKRVWLWHYSAFLLWNAVTTFWVCNATVGGGIFACVANAFQMSLVFGLFRWSRKYLRGSLPYIFLAALWIAWEKYYLDVAQISWPWLLLGNAFARTVSLVQWYEWLGTLGGSLWVWASNLSVFALMVFLSDGSWFRFNAKARFASAAAALLIFFAPAILSMSMYYGPAQQEGDTLKVVALQPNIDPYHKFQALSQSQQNVILLEQLKTALSGRKDTSALLAVAPETFTNDIVTGDYERSMTYRRFREFLKQYHNVNLLFGASSYSYIESAEAPSYTARKVSDGLWVESHNSALMVDGTDEAQIYHKSKLVVAVEMTPYPAFFCKIDDLLGGVMGRCIGQKEVSLLSCRTRDAEGKVVEDVPLGCAVCYESVYPEHCAEYVRKGAKALAIITNDAWWGNTPGYRQHLSYASLRAIETRRDIVRSANTGISAIIDSRGDIVSKTAWWEPAVLEGEIHLSEKQTFFVTQGDIVGRLCAFMAVMLLLFCIVRKLSFRQE